MLNGAFLLDLLLESSLELNPMNVPIIATKRLLEDHLLGRAAATLASAAPVIKPGPRSEEVSKAARSGASDRAFRLFLYHSVEALSPS